MGEQQGGGELLELAVAILGSATVAAVVTHLLGRRKTAAEIGLIGAQSDKTAAESEKIRAETHELYAKLERRAETIEGEIVDVIDLANASLIRGAAQSEGRPTQLIEKEISQRLRSIAGASERSVRSDNLDLFDSGLVRTDPAGRVVLTSAGRRLIAK